MSSTERQRRWRERHFAARSEELVAENATLKAEIAKLRKAAKAAPSSSQEELAVARWEAELAALKDENHSLRVELEARNHVFKTRAGGGLSNAQLKMLLTVAHPDNSASKETRERAFRLINQLRYVLCNEAELPSMDQQKYSIWAQRLWKKRQEGIKEANKHAKRRGQPKASKPQPVRGLRDK